MNVCGISPSDRTSLAPQRALPVDTSAAAETASPADKVSLGSASQGQASKRASCTPDRERTPISASAIDSQVVCTALGGSLGKTLGNLLTGLQFIVPGLVYKAEGSLSKLKEQIATPFAHTPVPTIKRPFVLIPGFGTSTDQFLPLTSHLTRDGANGGQTIYVKQGQFFSRDEAGNLISMASCPKGAKVFEMVFSDNKQSPSKNLPEMQANFSAIKKATGYHSFDAQGYSMGGIDARLYIDQGGKSIHRLMLLGTPNRGAGFATKAEAIIDQNVGWAMKFGGILPTDREALEWLKPESSNPQLADLNSRWAQQAAAVPTLTVGTDTQPTPSILPGRGEVAGDGLVSAESLQLPGGDCVILHDLEQHGHLNNDDTIQQLRAAYFGWNVGA